MTHAAMAATGQPSHRDVPLARERAALYAWFATIYAEEMPEDRLAGWLGHGADPLLQALADGGMEREVQAVRHSLQAMAGIPDIQLELAADYAQCFLLDARSSAPLYASCYQTGTAPRLFGATADRLAAYMASHDLRTDPDCREPMDHLAMELELLSWMILNDPPAAQEMQQDLLDWLPAFNERCQSISDRFGFYPAITALLLQVVLNDHDE